MFLNTNNLKKKKLTYVQGEICFGLCDDVITFDEISAFFRSSTDHYCNSVYEGTCLRVELYFSTQRDSLVLEVDSNHVEHGRLLTELADAIQHHRHQLLERQYQADQAVEFFVRGQNQPLRMEGTELFRGSVRVDALRCRLAPGGTVVELDSAGKTTNLSVNDISDAPLFLALANSCVPLTMELKERENPWPGRIFWVFLIVFGVNGWMREYDLSLGMENSYIEGISVFAGIFLGVRLFVWPVYWLVGRLSERRLERHIRRLKGE